MKQKNFLSFLKGIAIGVVAVCTAYSVKAQSYSYKSVKGDPMQSRIYTLKNGLKVFVSVNKENHVYKHILLCVLVVVTILPKLQG